MKKILTLMVMFAMTAGILSTQAQTLSYQVVVRDRSNNLVVNQELNVNVQINGYSQNIIAKTNLNGMLSLTIGPSEELSNIQWNNAKISLNFNNTNIRNITEQEVYPVPYALEARFLLTTPLIVDYINNMSVTGENPDWARVYTALRGNTSFFNAMRDTVVEYVKANYALARNVAFHYLSNLTPKDVKDAYDTFKVVMENNKELDSMLNVVMMDYVRNHRAMAFELAEYYAQHANARDVQKFYDAVMSNTEVVDPIMDSILIVFLKEFGLDPACMADYNYTYCQVIDAAANLGNMGPCTEITNVKNSVDDGLIALYENKGVVYTAYVKNFRNDNVVVDYGFLQSKKSDPNHVDTIRPRSYQAITKQFGKFTYLMNKTETCGDTLYVKAFITLSNDSIPSGCQDNTGPLTSQQMTVAVPTFNISIVQEGSTLKATFDSQEARDAFNIKKNNVKWIINGEEYDLTGLSINLDELEIEVVTVSAIAHLGNCIKESNELEIEQ